MLTLLIAPEVYSGLPRVTVTAVIDGAQHSVGYAPGTARTLAHELTAAATLAEQAAAAVRREWPDE